LSAPDRQGAFAALGEGQKILSHLDRARGPEDAAADIIELWNSAERALRSLVGQEDAGGQQLVRLARQGEIITLDQAHSLLEFLAARDRVNRTSYTPTPGDTEAARNGFNALEAAASGNAPATPPAQSSYGPPSPYAPPVPGAVPYMRSKADQDALAAKQNVPQEAPSATPPGGYSVAATSGDRWRHVPLWVKIGIPLVILLLIIGGYLMMGGSRGAQSSIDAGIAAMNNGQVEAARREFSTASQRDPSLADPHVFLARLSRQEGDLATARSQLDEALRLEPKNYKALREMGLVMFASRNYDLARRFFVRAATVNPNDRATLGYLGCTMMRLNRTVEGAKFLSEAGTGAWSACAQPAQVAAPPL